MKPLKLPTYYRRITITALIGKIISCHMLSHTDSLLDAVQSRMQFGFTHDLAPIFAAVIITEIMSQALDNNEELFITFLDTSKAFDVVSHKCMLNALQLQGMGGKLWKLYDSMYTGSKSVVKWQGEISEPLVEKQGIKQGEKTAASCYKAGKNRLLNRLDINPTLHIGNIGAGAVMVADDLAIASKDPHDMQSALYTAQLDASRERYRYNTDKTKTLAINSKTNPVFRLNDQPLETTKGEVHLGIHRSSDGRNDVTTVERLKSARRACYSMRDSGLRGLDGAGPEIALSQYCQFVIPTLLYGLEALVLEADNIEKLERYHRRNLRYIQHLPQSTAIPAVYLLLGTLPIEAQVDIRLLTLFRNVITPNPSVPPALYIREIVARQLITTSDESNSWARHITKILAKYNLPSAYTLLDNPPKKLVWKHAVKAVVQDEWSRRLREEAEMKSTLRYLDIQACRMGSIHPVWRDIHTDLDIKKATIKAQVLTQRYPLASSPTSGNRGELCPLCREAKETTKHFLLYCPGTRQDRLPYLTRILDTCKINRISIDIENLIQVILDSSSLLEADTRHERMTRNMIFKMHH